MKLLLIKRASKHNSHTNLSSLSCQTLFIKLNIIEYSTGPFALAQHSASATKYISKSLLYVFLQEKNWRLKLKTNKTVLSTWDSRQILTKLGCRMAALFLYLALKKGLDIVMTITAVGRKTELAKIRQIIFSVWHLENANCYTTVITFSMWKNLLPDGYYCLIAWFYGNTLYLYNPFNILLKIVSRLCLLPVIQWCIFAPI